MENKEEDRFKQKVYYRVEDSPSLPLWFVFGLQQAVMCITATLSIPFLITRQICAGLLVDVTAKLLSVTFFMCGVATLLQDTFGVRLPIIQGGSHTFIPPIIAMMSLKKWECPPDDMVAGDNTTEAAWLPRIREIQGNLMLASLTQVILGCTGLMGFLLRFIGPLTIAPTISLIGLSLTVVVNDFSQAHWGIAVLSMCLLLIFSLFLGNFRPPVPGYSRDKGCHVIRYPVFQLLPANRRSTFRDIVIQNNIQERHNLPQAFFQTLYIYMRRRCTACSMVLEDMLFCNFSTGRYFSL